VSGKSGEHVSGDTELSSKASGAFSFGAKRSSKTGPRRLFTPHRSALSPAYQIRQERPHAILRMISGA